MKQKLLLVSASLICVTLLSICGTAQHEDHLHAHEKDGGHSQSDYSGKSPVHPHGEGDHEHGMIAIPEGDPVPTVDLIVHEDAVKGWNLEVQVSNFRFAPENVNKESNHSEGHAHLYINGKKITRLYGNWYYISKLEPGRNEIKVNLNANGHEALMYNGQMIEDTEIIQIPF
ncbi:MAG: hypothetical protein AB4426_30735 [Xenococcaceae cyanobacterium]